jgi:phosphoribosylglycinamide formyltransferase-1
MQGVVEVRDDDTPDTLSARILAIEHQIYPNALRLLAAGKLRLDGAICRLNDEAAAGGTLIAPQPASAR